MPHAIARRHAAAQAVALRALGLLVLLTAAGAAGATTARAQTCVGAEEAAAFQLRHLQTQLMVGALQCRGVHALGQRTYYNRFATRHAALIDGANATLSRFFDRHFDGAARARLDAYVTGLANDVSAASRRTDAYCVRVAALGLALAGNDRRPLAGAAAEAPLAPRSPFPACTRQQAAATPGTDRGLNR
ncbi:hypothetical protein EV659_10480 [Rhodothalassium salexigens DSM 2132]|uniref:Uncharacterized protein n=1 Tax=Rhodothalassium salexigens DSM 2132 TaxID=1188247 RepID=A0A4R2PIE8_RHOSA|nr:hypothetical protein [Rhodothalassium salexigens]MBB4211308.1 hypothetical protein [Rhodothalassium salexigens DSM 2132]MBK1639368.1 hypothetical protein [Rhodothalassium salexigens DSM 2132]TCP35230.1 hypothetical protein EV659_10480 [Rhodothalassium salexigens DSM 2132]